MGPLEANQKVEGEDEISLFLDKLGSRAPQMKCSTFRVSILVRHLSVLGVIFSAHLIRGSQPLEN